MPSIKIPLNNFQFGEISGALTSRTDTQVYSNAGEEIRNFWIRAEGGLKKRAGTRRHYSFGSSSFTKAAMQIQVEDAESFVGNYIQFQLNDGTNVNSTGYINSESNYKYSTFSSATLCYDRYNIHYFDDSYDSTDAITYKIYLAEMQVNDNYANVGAGSGLTNIMLMEIQQ